MSKLSEQFPWLEGVEDWADDVNAHIYGFMAEPVEDQVMGMYEGGRAIAQDLGNTALSGLGALVTMPYTGREKATEALQRRLTTDRLIPEYKPQSQAGNTALSGLATAEAPLEAAGKAAGDFTMELTGSPAAATAAQLGPEALAEVLFTRGAGNAIKGVVPDAEFSDIGATGPGRKEAGAIKIRSTDSTEGESYEPRSSTEGANMSLAEEPLVQKPEVETREADRQSTPGWAGNGNDAMFGSSIPEGMRFLDRNDGAAKTWIKDLNRKGVNNEEIRMFMPDLLKADPEQPFTRDQIFDLYDSAETFQMGVRRAGEGVGYGTAERADATNRRTVQEKRQVEDAQNARMRQAENHVLEAYDLEHKIDRSDGPYEPRSDTERADRAARTEAVRTAISELDSQARLNPADDPYSISTPAVGGGDGNLDLTSWDDLKAHSEKVLRDNGVPRVLTDDILRDADRQRQLRKERINAEGLRDRTRGSGGGMSTNVANSSMNTGYRYPGGVDRQTWLFNQRVGANQPQGSTRHFGSATVAGSMDIEGARVANLGHMRTDRRGVFAESYVDPETGETKWRDVEPRKDSEGDLWRPATQHMGEGQSDTHQDAYKAGYFTELTPEQIAERDQYSDIYEQSRQKLVNLNQTKDDLDRNYAERNPEQHFGETLTSAYHSYYDQFKYQEPYASLPVYERRPAVNVAVANELSKNAHSLTPQEMQALSEMASHYSHIGELQREIRDTDMVAQQARTTVHDMNKVETSDLPRLHLGKNSERQRFMLRSLVNEAVRNGDEYVSISSMRQQGEVYNYGGLGPEEGAGSGTGQMIHWDDNAQEFRDQDGEEVDGDTLPDDLRNDIEINAADYADWRDDAETAWMDERESELIHSGEVREVTEYEADGEYFEYESEAQDHLRDQYIERNPPPDEEDFQIEDDDGDMDTDHDAYNEAFEEWEDGQTEWLDDNPPSERNYVTDPDGDMHEDGDVNDVAREHAEYELRNGYIDDDDLGSALGEEWHERMEGSAVEWAAEDADQATTQISDPDVGLLDESWGGSDGGKTERMAKANYETGQVYKNLRRTLRDLGLSDSQILEAVVRVNMDVSGKPGVGRQQNVQAIKITDSIRRAVADNKKGLFKNDPDRTTGKYESSGWSGAMDKAMQEREALERQDKDWDKKNVRAKPEKSWR